MSSDGLHLFFDAIRSKEHENVATGTDLLQVVEFVKLAVKQDKTEDETRRYNELATSLGDSRVPEKNSFEFVVPEHSLDSWLQYLQTEKGVTSPLRGVHYRDTYNSYSGNSAENSYEVDVEEAGIAYRDSEVARQVGVQFSAAQLENLLVTGRRIAREANRLARTRTKNWFILQRVLHNDTRIEDSLLRYLDEDRKKPEWSRVISNLKQYGESAGYTLDHYKQALDRWISFFLSSLQNVTGSMGANEIAKLLIDMHSPKSRFDILQKEMLELVRHPGEELNAKIALLRALAQGMYSDFPESERIANVDRVLLNGIFMFTHGSTRKNAELAIEFQKRQGRKIDFDSILQGAIASERVYGAPTKCLPYNAPLKPATMVYNTNVDSCIEKKMQHLAIDDVEPMLEKAVESFFLKAKIKKDERKRDKKSSKSSKQKVDLSSSESSSESSSDDSYYSRDKKRYEQRSSHYHRKNRRDNKKRYSTRDSSAKRKWNEEDIELGINCSKNYNPQFEMRCLKCMTENEHHEFNCKTFYRRSRFVCKNCGRGFHFCEECDEEEGNFKYKKN